MKRVRVKTVAATSSSWIMLIEILIYRIQFQLWSINGENFVEQEVLESHGDCLYTGIDYDTGAYIGVTDDTNENDDIEDSAMGVFEKNTNELIYKVDSDSKTYCRVPVTIKSSLLAGEILVDHKQVPGINEFNYLKTNDNTKIMLLKGDKLVGYEIVNGFYSPQLPIKPFNL